MKVESDILGKKLRASVADWWIQVLDDIFQLWYSLSLISVFFVQLLALTFGPEYRNTFPHMDLCAFSDRICSPKNSVVLKSLVIQPTLLCSLSAYGCIVQVAIENLQLFINNRSELLLGPKAPSLKLQTVCFFSFRSTSCMVHAYVPTIYKASEPEQVATSDLERSYDFI